MRKVTSQYISDEEGRMLRDSGYFSKVGAVPWRFSQRANLTRSKPDIIAGLPQRPVINGLGVEPTEKK